MGRMDESTSALLRDEYGAANGGVDGLGSVQGAINPPGIRKKVFGIFIVIGIAVSWVGATQASKSAYTAKADSFHAPFFSMWFSTVWFAVAFPIVLLVRVLSRAATDHGPATAAAATAATGPPHLQTNISAMIPAIFHAAAVEIIDSPLHAPRQRPAGAGVGATCVALAKTAGPFLLLWSGANYSYSRALMTTSASDVTAVFSATPALVYVLSLLLLGDRFAVLPLLAVLVTIGGIVLVALSEDLHGLKPVGIILTLVAAACAATYKVCLKRAIGDASASAIALLLTTIAVLDVALLWPVWLILDRETDETFDWAEVPWHYLAASAAAGLCFNFLINFGIAFTYPLFISLGTVLGIPLNLVIDHFFRHVEITGMKAAGAGLVILGFIILAVPAQRR